MCLKEEFSHPVSKHLVLNSEYQMVLESQTKRFWTGIARTPLLPTFTRTSCNYAEKQRNTCAPLQRNTKSSVNGCLPLPLSSLWSGRGRKKKEAGSPGKGRKPAAHPLALLLPVGRKGTNAPCLEVHRPKSSKAQSIGEAKVDPSSGEIKSQLRSCTFWARTFF